MTIRILCYSLTGNTRHVAEDLGRALDAPVHLMEAPGPEKPGLWSILKLGFRVLTRARAKVRVPEIDWAASETLILGGPVWMGRLSVPMRTWLETRPALPDRVALLITSGSAERPETLIEEVTKLTGRVPVAVLHVPEAAVKAGDFAQPVASFCRKVLGRSEREVADAPQPEREMAE